MFSPLNLRDDLSLEASRTQRMADADMEWPSYEIHPDGGIWAPLLGYRVRLVSGPVVCETDNIVYPTYLDALMARTAMEMSDAEDRLLAAPFEKGLGETIPLSERQEAAAYRAEEYELDRSMGREE